MTQRNSHTIAHEIFICVRECFGFAKLLKAAAQAKACQSMCLPQCTDRKRKSTIAQHCIRAIAGEAVKSRSVHLINFGGGGQVIALKSNTVHTCKPF